jgi:hypothetical protein
VTPDPSFERTATGKALGPHTGQCHHPSPGQDPQHAQVAVAGPGDAPRPRLSSRVVLARLTCSPHAANYRPLSNTWPLPTIATRHVAVVAPTPLSCINCLVRASSLA